MWAWIAGIFQIIGHGLQVALTAVVHALGIAARAIWIALKATAVAIEHAVQALGESILWLWNNAIRPAFEAIGAFARDLYSWAKNALTPLVSFLKKVQSWLNYAWVHVVSKILAALDLVHIVLSGLAKLGVKWAAKVDDVVFSIRNEIFDAWRSITGKLNDALTVLSLFTDPRGIFKRVPFLWTFAAYAGDLLRVFAQLGLKNVGPAFVGSGARGLTQQALTDFGTGKLMASDATQAAVASFDELTADLE